LFNNIRHASLFLNKRTRGRSIHHPLGTDEAKRPSWYPFPRSINVGVDPAATDLD
jgi:hypothetical protein